MSVIPATTAQSPAAALALVTIALTLPVSSSRTFKKPREGPKESVSVGAQFLIQPSSTLVTWEEPGEIHCKVSNSRVHFECDGNLYEPTSSVDYTRTAPYVEYTRATHAFLQVNVWRMRGVPGPEKCWCNAISDNGTYFQSEEAVIYKASKFNRPCPRRV